MTQHAAKTFPAGRVLLVIAAMVAAFAIVFAVSRGRETAPAPAPSAAAQGPSLIADLEKAAAAAPQDAGAWQKLGFAYFEQSRFADAARAYEKATTIDANQALTWSALGEARVMASERDPMPPAAAQAFEKAVSIDPKDPRARYFLAVRKDIGGDHQGALDDWLALLADTPADAPWRGDLVRTIQQVGQINKVDVAQRLADAGAKSPPPVMPAAARGIPGPSAADLAAARQIAPGEQRTMAEGMVSRLEERLKAEPANVDGWVMLMRSRMTLGQPDKAAKALADGIAANPARADYLRQQAGILGIR